MSFFGELARRLSMLFRRSQFDAELEEEMRLHLELREQQQLQTGMTQPAARSALAAGFEIPQCSRRKPQDLEMPPKLPPSEPYYAPSCTSRKSEGSPFRIIGCSQEIMIPQIPFDFAFALIRRRGQLSQASFPCQSIHSAQAANSLNVRPFIHLSSLDGKGHS
jgi:hypothetical protein